MPRPTPMGIRHEVFALAVRALSKVLLLPVWVWLVLPSTAYSIGMLPLDRWCQASLQGLPERQHLGKTMHCWGWSDRIVSWVLGPWRRGWEICTEWWGLVAQRLTTDSCPVVTGHIDPTTKSLLTANHCHLSLEWAQRWRNLTVAHWQHVIFGDESRFQLYPVDGIIKCRQNWQNTTEWNWNNHKKDTSSQGVTTFFAKSVWPHFLMGQPEIPQPISIKNFSEIHAIYFSVAQV